jgi:hypothetical protein
MSHSPERFKEEMDDIMGRIKEHIDNAIVNNKAGAIGNSTFLDKDSGYILATLNVERY